MKVNLCFLFLLIFSSSLNAQYTLASYPENQSAPIYSHTPINTIRTPYRKLFQRNYGAIIGIQRGKSTSFELGGEAHWRKISLRKPHIIGATANLEYNFCDHVMEYKAGMWMKRGRVNLTYGANLVYFTDFNNHSRYGIGPAVGFRLLGFHLINGFNFLTGDKKPEKVNTLDRVNTLYVSLRYYFPVENKFTWDRKTKIKKEREKRKKEKVKEKKRKEREKRREEKPSLLDRLKKPFKKE